MNWESQIVRTFGWIRRCFRTLSFISIILTSGAYSESNGMRLFPANLQERQWISFHAEGFSSPVTGVIYRPSAPPCCGMPLGGVGTGCIDLDVRGTFGFISAFSQLFSEYAFSGTRGNVFKAPLTRKLPDYSPFLGVSVNSTTWVLASKGILEGGTMETCVDPVFIGRKESISIPPVNGVLPARGISYWGHFPVVDMEYDLATLRIVERMARAMEDEDYAAQCHQWFHQGSRSMEEKMWNGSYYLNFYDDQTGEKSDAIMAYQLDGDWAARLHGVESVFRGDRIPLVLRTIREKCMGGVVCGARSFSSPEGKPLNGDNKVAEYGTTAMFLPEIMMLAMTYMYHGEPGFGIEKLRKAMEYMVCSHGHPWDLPNMILGSTGERHFGTDYYQNLMLWAVPSALSGESLDKITHKGNLADRIIQAVNAEE